MTTPSPNPSPTQPAEAATAALEVAINVWLEANFHVTNTAVAFAAGWNARGEEVEAALALVNQHCSGMDPFVNIVPTVAWLIERWETCLKAWTLCAQELKESEDKSQAATTRLAAVEGERDGLRESLSNAQDGHIEMNIQRDQAIVERDHWKANHDEQVKRKRQMRDILNATYATVRELRTDSTTLRHRLTDLESALAAAPHERGCGAMFRDGEAVGKCTCWKATAPTPEKEGGG